MAGPDIRWRQRFDNFQRALLVLERGVRLARLRELSELEQQGLIQGYEFTHELAWNLLKDYLSYQGVAPVVGSRDATRLAFQSSHTYNLAQAQAIARDVIERFYPAFTLLQQKFATLAESLD